MQYDLFGDAVPEEKQTSTCPVIKKGKVKLSTAQSEFNRLNKKIALLREELGHLSEKKRRIGEFYKDYILPLVVEYNSTLFTTLCKLDAQYDKGELEDNDLFALSGVILDKCSILTQDMRGTGEDEKKATLELQRKHEKIQTGLSDKDLNKVKVKELLQIFTFTTGFKPTAKMKKAKSEEELTELIEQFMLDKMKEEFEAQSQKDEFGKEKSFTWDEQKEEPRQKQKMTQADLKRKIQAEQTLKSMRTIYMELAKELHPDREQDEALRAVKEEKMKQLTEAYQKKDLAALLTMQVSWLEETVKIAPGELSDEILKGYNKILKTQLKKLEEEQDMAKYSISDLPDEMCDMLAAPLSKLDTEFDCFLNAEQSAIKEMQQMCKAWCTKRGLKKLIKEHQQEDEFNDFFDELMNEDMLDDLMKAMMSGKAKF